jgi:hypothetical protein
VAFTETPTEISQAVSGGVPQCLLFTSVADVAPEAQMMFLVDFDSDGTIDFQIPIASTQWHKIESEITSPATSAGATFRVRKEGTGTAILAELRVQSTSGCSGPPTLTHPVLLNEACSADTPCGGSLFCQQPDPTAAGVCAQCGQGHPCPSGVPCAPRASFAGDNAPNQCGPGRKLGAPGDPCLADDDCASGTCRGGVLGDCYAPSTPQGLSTTCAPDAAPAVDSGCVCKTRRGGTCL